MGIMWTLEDGLKLIRGLQDLAKECNYHVTLGGGVLNSGESSKDVDLYFLPFDNGAKGQTDNLVTSLKKLWGEPKNIGPGYAGESEDPYARIKKKYGIRGANHVRAAAQPFFHADLAGEAAQWAMERAEHDGRGHDQDYINHLQGLRYGALAEFRNRTGEIPLEPLLTTEQEAARLNPEPSCYKHKFKFYREAAGDRIDVFIM